MRLSPLLLVAAATIGLAGCSASNVAEPAESSFSVRPVLAVGVPETSMSASAAGVLEDAGLEPTNEGADVLTWLEVGDCEVATPEPTLALAVACDSSRNEVLLMGEALVGGESIADVEFMEGEPDQLGLTFDDAGSAALANATAAVLELPAPKNRIALMVDGNVVAAPHVMNAIDNGEVVISGGDLADVAEALKPLAD